jgi:hypothetical protein
VEGLNAFWLRNFLRRSEMVKKILTCRNKINVIRPHSMNRGRLFFIRFRLVNYTLSLGAAAGVSDKGAWGPCVSPAEAAYRWR